jgi:hypothetical protein
MDTTNRHQEYWRKARKKVIDLNKNYKGNVEHMKEYKEDQLQKKTNDLVERLKQKEKLLLTSLRKKSNSRLKEKQKIIDSLVEREEKAREKVKKYMDKQELKRLQLQKSSTDRGKNIYYINNQF